MISNLHLNRMGTISFDAQFKGMRKPQEFIVYPLHEGNESQQILIQSDTRIGYIKLETGLVWMSRSHAGGAYSRHLAERTIIDQLTQEELFNLKAHIFSSASGKAGSNGIVYTDNSAALNVFGATA